MSGAILVERGEVLGCANPKLMLTVEHGGVLVDPAVSIEFAVFDLEPAPPVQTFPVVPGTFEALTLLDCPAGQRLATGQYAASWTVDAAEPQTLHRISWRWQRSLTDPVETADFDFNISFTAATAAESPELCSFRTRFPDFALASEYPADLLEMIFAEARQDLSKDLLGDRHDRALALYVAHSVSYMSGARGKGATSVSAGQASISYGAALPGMTYLSSTSYGRALQNLLRRSTGGCTVWGG